MNKHNAVMSHSMHCICHPDVCFSIVYQKLVFKYKAILYVVDVFLHQFRIKFFSLSRKI